MNSNKTILKIVIIIAFIAVILLIIGLALSRGEEGMERPRDDRGSMNSEGREDLDRINESSRVDEDMDAYIRASDNPSNPNDFNDSYSDLNR
jgi:FtsZ-interacting cell division protein ZipA